GRSANARVYSRALSATEIQSDQNTAISARPLLAQASPAGSGGGDPLTQAELAPVVDEAVARWSTAGASPDQLELLRDVRVQVEDLPAPYLGLAVRDRVWLRRNAAGYGWFRD